MDWLAPLLNQLESHASGGGALAFDGDGTLWSGDVGEDLFEYAIEQRLFLTEGGAALSALAREFGVQTASDAAGTARQLLQAYRTHQLPELQACEMMTWAYAGFDETTLRQRVDAVQLRSNLQARRFAPLRTVIDWGRKRGLRIIVVSASPQFVVERAVHALGIAPADVTACRLQLRDGLYTAELDGACPYAQQKVKAAQSLLGSTPLIAAFGDNGFDVELLQSARVPVAVRPKQALRARLGELVGGWTLDADGVVAHSG